MEFIEYQRNFLISEKFYSQILFLSKNIVFLVIFSDNINNRLAMSTACIYSCTFLCVSSFYLKN